MNVIESTLQNCHLFWGVGSDLQEISRIHLIWLLLHVSLVTLGLNIFNAKNACWAREAGKVRYLCVDHTRSLHWVQT